MSEMTFRFPLTDPNCSGRGVQCKVLSSSEVRDIYAALAKSGATENGATFILALQIEGIKRMVTHVTKEPLQAPLDANTAMTPVTLEDFELPSSPLRFDKLFNAKDVEELTVLYSTYHQMSGQERENLQGKVIIVSLG